MVHEDVPQFLIRPGRCLWDLRREASAASSVLDGLIAGIVIPAYSQ